MFPISIYSVLFLLVLIFVPGSMFVCSIWYLRTRSDIVAGLGNSTYVLLDELDGSPFTWKRFRFYLDRHYSKPAAFLVWLHWSLFDEKCQLKINNKSMRNRFVYKFAIKFLSDMLQITAFFMRKFDLP